MLKRRISVAAQLVVPEQAQCEPGLFLCRRDVVLTIHSMRSDHMNEEWNERWEVVCAF